MIKTLLVTGGSRGIGSAIIREAIGKYNIAFFYNKSEDNANKLIQELQSKGSVIAIKCDVSKSEEVEKAIIKVKEKFGKIDCLVNNAGISQSKLFTDITDSDWKQMMSVNLDGTFYVTREVVKDMIWRKDGAIVNISSMWGQVGSSMETHYSASKAGVIGLTKSLAKELSLSNIRVNCVAPGAIDTDMMSDYSEEDMKCILEDIPLQRLGTAKEIAKSVLFLIESEYITGQVIGVNGGMVI